MNPEIHLEKTSFAPGGIIRGSVHWTREDPPRSAEVRLFWYTLGKGDRDSETAAAVVLDHPQASDRRDFQFTAPAFPPSMSGKLVSVLWAVECLVEPGAAASTDIVIAPDSLEIAFDHEEWMELTDVPKAGGFSFGR